MQKERSSKGSEQTESRFATFLLRIRHCWDNRARICKGEDPSRAAHPAFDSIFSDPCRNLHIAWSYTAKFGLSRSITFRQPPHSSVARNFHPGASASSTAHNRIFFHWRLQGSRDPLQHISRLLRTYANEAARMPN
ncbi:uncharacterized protein VTP21DRAFT_7463 [Calcarisporiella thermophila]|uniref:uncharacterized protein n=1 Tax=Calcarisporiella thermophila TaxID=911321 RepID=UPI0037440807